MKHFQLYYFFIQSVLLITIFAVNVEETNIREDGPEIFEGLDLSLSLGSVSIRWFDVVPNVESADH